MESGGGICERGSETCLHKSRELHYKLMIINFLEKTMHFGVSYTICNQK